MFQTNARTPNLLWHFVTWDPTSNLTSSHWIFGIPSVQLHHVIWSAPDREPRPIAPWFNGKLMNFSMFLRHLVRTKNANFSKIIIAILRHFCQNVWSDYVCMWMVYCQCYMVYVCMWRSTSISEHKQCMHNLCMLTDACIHASLGLRISVNIHPHVYRQYIRHTSTYRIYNILYTYIWRT